MKQIIILFFLLLSTSACKNKTIEQENVPIFIDIKHEANYSEIFEKEYQTITLETNDEILINKIDKIQITDSSLFILDKRQSFVLEFDRDGWFKRKFHHKGHGASEYLSLEDFEAYGEHIYMLSRTSKKIFVYTLENEFIEAIDLKESFDYFHIVNEKRLLLYSNNCNEIGKNLILYDYQKQRFIEEFLPFRRNENFSFPIHPFNLETKDGLLLTQPYSHCIYRYHKGILSKDYSFSFNTRDQFPEDIQNHSFYDLYSKTLLGKSLVNHIEHIAEIDSALFISFMLDYKFHLTKIKLSNFETVHLTLNDNSEYPFSFAIPLMFWNKSLVSWVHAEGAIELFGDSIKSSKNVNGLLDEEDNPIIVIRKIK